MTGPGADAELIITVVRQGGFAGLTREWSVVPEPPERREWVLLVDACPWDHVVDGVVPDEGMTGATTGATRPDRAGHDRDRFTWVIRVSGADDGRMATLPERQLTGPWQQLVDRVRHAGDRQVTEARDG